MKELHLKEIEQVNGGLEPVMTAFLVGFVAGAIYEWLQ